MSRTCFIRIHKCKIFLHITLSRWSFYFILDKKFLYNCLGIILDLSFRSSSKTIFYSNHIVFLYKFWWWSWLGIERKLRILLKFGWKKVYISCQLHMPSFDQKEWRKINYILRFKYTPPKSSQKRFKQSNGNFIKYQLKTRRP